MHKKRNPVAHLNANNVKKEEIVNKNCPKLNQSSAGTSG